MFFGDYASISGEADELLEFHRQHGYTVADVVAETRHGACGDGHSFPGKEVNDPSLEFPHGGGGHINASGFIIQGDVSKTGDSVIQKILDEVKQQGWI